MAGSGPKWVSQLMAYRNHMVQHRDTVMRIYTQISANDDRAMPNPFDLDDRL